MVEVCVSRLATTSHPSASGRFEARASPQDSEVSLRGARPDAHELGGVRDGSAGRTGQTAEEAAIYDRFRATPNLSPDEIMPAFIVTQLAPGVEPPPSPTRPPPSWMPSCLLAIGSFMAAFDAYEPDFDVLRAFDRPVYFALGRRGNPDPAAPRLAMSCSISEPGPEW